VNDYKVRVGAQIRRARRRHGWSQNELARRTGILELTSSQISRWERGEVMPMPHNLETLERALGVKFVPDDDNDDNDDDEANSSAARLPPEPLPA
jgi:transcriptional regulator with XRE-family HTH domain